MNVQETSILRDRRGSRRDAGRSCLDRRACKRFRSVSRKQGSCQPSLARASKPVRLPRPERGLARLAIGLARAPDRRPARFALAPRAHLDAPSVRRECGRLACHVLQHAPSSRTARSTVLNAPRRPRTGLARDARSGWSSNSEHPRSRSPAEAAGPPRAPPAPPRALGARARRRRRT